MIIRIWLLVFITNFTLNKRNKLSFQRYKDMNLYIYHWKHSWTSFQIKILQYNMDTWILKYNFEWNFFEFIIEWISSNKWWRNVETFCQSWMTTFKKDKIKIDTQVNFHEHVIMYLILLLEVWHRIYMNILIFRIIKN